MSQTIDLVLWLATRKAVTASMPPGVPIFTARMAVSGMKLGHSLMEKEG